MTTLQQRNAVRLLLKRLFLFCLLGVFLGILTGVWDVYNKDKESAELKQQAQVQLADLQTRENQLNGDIDRLQTDRGKEEAVRQQYEMAKPGEGMILIVDQDATTTQATSTAPQKGWFAKLFHW